MRDSDKRLLVWFAAGLVMMLGGAFALMFLWTPLAGEDLRPQVLSAFSLVLLTGAVGMLLGGALDKGNRRLAWSAALGSAVRGAELMLLVLLARPLLEDMGAPRFVLLLVGYWVWAQGTSAFVGSLVARPLRGGRGLFVGLAVMAAALFMAN